MVHGDGARSTGFPMRRIGSQTASCCGVSRRLLLPPILHGAHLNCAGGNLWDRALIIYTQDHAWIIYRTVL